MTLTQTAILTKQVIFFSTLISIVGITSLIGYKYWYNFIYLPGVPPVEEKADTNFGLLPVPDFPISNVSSSNFTYSLDTTTGLLPKIGQNPDFPPIIKVYFITKPYATLLSGEKSAALAEKFAITTAPQISSDTEYTFVQDQKTLSLDLDSGNFIYTNNKSSPAETIIDSEEQLIEGFKQTLNSLGLFKQDFEGGRKEVRFLKNATQIAEISLWMNDLDGKPIITPYFNKSLVNALVFKSASNIENYLSLEFTYWPIDASIFATYPLKDPQIAFDDLRSGKGVVIIEPLKPQVSITSISLGYFLPQKYNPYLQPVYIFEGAGFVAMVSAIDNEFIKDIKESKTTGN